MNRTATRSMIVLALCAAIGGPVSAGAEEKPGGSDQAGKQTTPAKDPGASKNVRRTVYVPPSRGAVGARTGGGTRGQTSAPRIAVLAPDHVGLTTRAQLRAQDRPLEISCLRVSDLRDAVRSVGGDGHRVRLSRGSKHARVPHLLQPAVGG